MQKYTRESVTGQGNALYIFYATVAPLLAGCARYIKQQATIIDCYHLTLQVIKLYLFLLNLIIVLGLTGVAINYQ